MTRVSGCHFQGTSSSSRCQLLAEPCASHCEHAMLQVRPGRRYAACGGGTAVSARTRARLANTRNNGASVCGGYRAERGTLRSRTFERPRRIVGLRGGGP